MSEPKNKSISEKIEEALSMAFCLSVGKNSLRDLKSVDKHRALLDAVLNRLLAPTCYSHSKDEQIVEYWRTHIETTDQIIIETIISVTARFRFVFEQYQYEECVDHLATSIGIGIDNTINTDSMNDEYLTGYSLMSKRVACDILKKHPWWVVVCALQLSNVARLRETVNAYLTQEFGESDE